MVPGFIGLMPIYFRYIRYETDFTGAIRVNEHAIVFKSIVWYEYLCAKEAYGGVVKGSASYILRQLIAARTWLAACVALGGCALTPSTQPPLIVDEIAGASGYVSSKDTAGAGDNIETIHWWRDLGGDELDGLVSTLISSNLDLTIARAQAEQAVERANQAHGARLPSVSASASPSYNRAPSGAGRASFNDGYSAGLSANFNTDIFGGLRATDRAARLAAKAAAVSYHDSEQTAVASLADSWVNAATLKRRLALAKSFAESFRVTHDLTLERYRAGSQTVSATNVQITKQSLDRALADIPALETELETQLFAIDVLLGRRPGEAAKVIQRGAIAYKGIRSCRPAERAVGITA